MIAFDSYIKENQWVVIAFCFAGWVTGTSMSTQSGYDNNCNAMLWKLRFSYLSLQHSQKENFPNSDSLWMFQRWPLRNTHEHTNTSLYFWIHVLLLLRLSLSSASVFFFPLSLIKAAKWWIVPYTYVSQCHSNWQNIRHLILLRSVTAHLLIRTHIQTAECAEDLCFAINDTSRVTGVFTQSQRLRI